MINLRVEPIGITVQMDNGQTLHEGLEKAGIIIEKPCGGMGICAECGVFVDSPEIVPSTPHENIPSEKDAQGVRLACQAVPAGDVTVHLTHNFSYGKDNGKPREKILVQSLLPDTEKLDPSVRISDKEGIVQLWHDRACAPVILDNWKASFKPRGLAIDIGTTTLAISLVCLETGKVLSSGAGINPQVRLGHDVLTRIQHSKTKVQLEEMADLVRNKLNSLLLDACKKSNVQAEEIVDVTLGANTTMLQLAAGMNSASIGRFPFNFDIQGGCSHPAANFGLKVNKAAKVYLPPIMHAFVGTDISAGLILCPDFFKTDKTVLFIDMGTNGEMCLNVKGRWYSASTAAGPAFEGMGLSSGMRAVDGAVDRVDYHNGNFQFHTIGNGKIKGICGSGLIDLLAGLLESADMDSSGRLQKNDSKNSFMVDMDGVLAIEYGEGIYLTQKDIRQIQLAKSAVSTGIELILQQGGVQSDQIDNIYLAGGFGAHLRTGNLSKIGFFDDPMAKKVTACGNTSLGGSIALLTHGEQRKFLENALDKMTYLSLAKTPGFMDRFMANLDFH